MTRSRGFTLLELLVSIGIMALIGTLALPALRTTRTDRTFGAFVQQIVSEGTTLVERASNGGLVQVGGAWQVVPEYTLTVVPHGLTYGYRDQSDQAHVLTDVTSSSVTATPVGCTFTLPVDGTAVTASAECQASAEQASQYQVYLVSDQAGARTVIFDTLLNQWYEAASIQ